MAKTDFRTIEEYIGTFSGQTRERLEKVRHIILETVPEAVETISYQIPTFKLNGTYLIYLSAAKNHIALHPASTAMDSSIKELSAYRSGKGTIRFPDSKPLPLPLIRKIVSFREQENRESAKKEKKQKADPRSESAFK